jgi:hypothetical protein
MVAIIYNNYYTPHHDRVASISCSSGFSGYLSFQVRHTGHRLLPSPTQYQCTTFIQLGVIIVWTVLQGELDFAQATWHMPLARVASVFQWTSPVRNC